jgi:putative protease
VNNFPFPTQELTYQGNVLNYKAAQFYRRHGVTKIEPAAESGLDLHGQRVMTTRHCLKHQLGWCPKEHPEIRLNEPLSLVDEQENIFPLRFRCKDCEMDVYFGELDG